MNQEKIGKLISELRKMKGLTQQDLGEKVGVGYRAVSKWERGLNLPDIAIIQDLCKILDITSDELLSGELSAKTKEKLNISKSHKRLSTILQASLIIILAITVILIFYHRNKEDTYDIITDEYSDYYIEGKVIFKGNDISIIINRLEFEDKQFNKIIIKNYDYQIISNDYFIYKYGYAYLLDVILPNMSVQEFTNSLIINCNEELTKLVKNKIINNDLILKMIFVDIDDNIISKDIVFKLVKSHDKSA